MAFAMKTEYWYVLLGGVGMVALAHYFPSLKKLDSLFDSGSTSELEQIPGIDLRSLAVCRQKGIM